MDTCIALVVLTAMLICRVDVLLLILKPALAFEDGKTWKWLWLTVIAWIIDVVAAHTTWALVAGWPRRNAWTISQTLEYLAHPSNSRHPDYLLYFQLAEKINRASPTGRHIKSVLSH
jgi:type VI protein secretion system component VasK